MSNNDNNQIKSAQGPFDTLEECIAAVMEEEQVDEAAAREICEKMDEEAEGDAPPTEEAGLHEVTTEIVRPRTIEFPTASADEVIEDLETDLSQKELYGDRDSVSGDLTGSVENEVNSLVIKQAQRQPGETTEACIARLMEEEDLSEAEAAEACGGNGEEASVRVAERKPGESIADCVDRIMEEDGVEEDVAREACEQIAGGGDADE